MINAHDIPNTNIKPMDAISELQLEKINRFTTTTFTREQLFTFEMLLIDDTMTRNFTLYPESFQRKMLKKPVGGGNWIGLPMLMGCHEDHEAMASNQVGRIYDAKLVKTPKGHIGTVASVYIPVNESNKSLIDNIKAGIHKEVSIGVSVEQPTCSICGSDVRECRHEPGDNYNGATCHIIMNGDVEGQEVSFVAVPGNLNAKILTDKEGYIPLTEALGKFRKSIRKESNKMAKRNKKLVSKESLELLKLAKFIEGSMAPCPDPTSGEARRFAEEDDEEDDDTHNDRNDSWTEEDDNDVEGDDFTYQDMIDGEDDDEYEESGFMDGLVGGAIGGIKGALTGASDGFKKGYEESDDEDDDSDEDDKDYTEELDEDDDEDKQEEGLLGLGLAGLAGAVVGSKLAGGKDKNQGGQNVVVTNSVSQDKVYKSIEKSLRNIYKSHEALQQQAEDGRIYKEQVLKETIRLGALAGVIPVQSKEMFKQTFSKLSTKELMAMQTGYKKQVEKMYPSTGRAQAMQESKKDSKKSTHKEKMSVVDIIKEFNK